MDSGATIVTFGGFHDDSWTISQCFSLQACDSAFSGLGVFSLICILPSRFLAVVFSWFCFALWLCACRKQSHFRRGIRREWELPSLFIVPFSTGNYWVTYFQGTLAFDGVSAHSHWFLVLNL